MEAKLFCDLHEMSNTAGVNKQLIICHAFL